MDRKMKALESLRDGAITPGERDAAQRGIDRVLKSKNFSHNALNHGETIDKDLMTGQKSFKKFHLYGTRKVAWNVSDESMGRMKDYSLSASLGDLIKRQQRIG